MNETLKRELKARIASMKYEAADNGLYFPGAGVYAHGLYVHDVNGRDRRADRNMLPTEGLNYLLSAALGAGTAASQWFLSIFSGNYTPTATITGATYAQLATEITSTSEGYTETARPQWTPAAAANGVIDNIDTKATFTIATASSLTVYGAALLSTSVKGDTTGTLASIARFATARVLNNGDKFNIGYRVTLTSA
jgi:hypothetical protein